MKKFVNMQDPMQLNEKERLKKISEPYHMQHLRRLRRRTESMFKLAVGASVLFSAMCVIFSGFHIGTALLTIYILMNIPFESLQKRWNAFFSCLPIWVRTFFTSLLLVIGLICTAVRMSG